MEKTVKLIEMIELFVGRRGRLVSSSKSCGPAMAVYNSNLVVGDEVLWYGDIDLEVSRFTLLNIAKLFDITIEIYSEMDIRVFAFDNESEEEIKKKHKENIAKSTPVWTTADPFNFAGKDWDEMLELNESHREKMRNRRAIAYGLLTPNGTDWKWYNTWYYNGPHKLYRCVRFFYGQFIEYPLDFVEHSKSKYVDGEKVEVKLSFIEKVKIFVKMFKKEIGYHKKAFETGEIKSIRSYLFDH